MNPIKGPGDVSGGLSLSPTEKMILQALIDINSALDNFTNDLISGEINIGGEKFDATSSAGMFGLSASLKKAEMMTLALIQMSKAQEKNAENMANQLQSA